MSSEKHLRAINRDRPEPADTLEFSRGLTGCVRD